MDPVDLKSFWKEHGTHVWSFFCPLCRAPRKVPYRARPGGAMQIFQIVLTSAVITAATWPWFGMKGIFSIVPLWTAFEIYYRTRVRAALHCPQCGFDPYLYLVDVKRARAEIDAHWRKKFSEKGIPFPEKGVPAVAAKAKDLQEDTEKTSPSPNESLTETRSES